MEIDRTGLAGATMLSPFLVERGLTVDEYTKGSLTVGQLLGKSADQMGGAQSFETGHI